VIAILGLGSNMGDRRANLQAAIEDLWAHGVRAVTSSSVYETEPVGEVTDQPPFLNACLEVETHLPPHELLGACKAVEAALGRRLSGPGYVRHGPRPIDVDILLLDETVVHLPDLRVPHPELTHRRFVLVPLVELSGDIEIPGHGRAADALAKLPGDGQDVRRAGPPLELAD
jgi:2-amino-4-hydroxy-6-hydroxymethyldihydropteridine diphosphokinase